MKQSAKARTAAFTTDILTNSCESGIDLTVRFDSLADIPYACVDATCHLLMAYQAAVRWAVVLGQDAPAGYAQKAAQLTTFIQTGLYDKATGFFYDRRACLNPAYRTVTFAGFWPLICGAATPEQADSALSRYLFCPDHFYTAHPLPYVSPQSDVARKGEAQNNAPSPDYLGHNPMLALARSWQSL